MEIEVKFRFLTQQDYSSFIEFCMEKFKNPSKIQEQRNIFFDGSKKEITGTKSVLRLRFVNENSAELTFKAKSSQTDEQIAKGISMVQEQNEEMPYDTAILIEKDPNSLLNVSNSEIVKRMKEQFHVENLKNLGGFNNKRICFPYDRKVLGIVAENEDLEKEKIKLEVDETDFAFGKSYEIEIETVNPQIIQKEISALLENLKIKFEISRSTKFTNFMSGKIVGKKE